MINKKIGGPPNVPARGPSGGQTHNWAPGQEHWVGPNFFIINYDHIFLCVSVWVWPPLVVRLSPFFFNVFINVLIVALKLNDFDCHANKCFVGCLLYADDIILVSASIAGLQNMLKICDSTISTLQLKFNCSKCFCVCFGLRFNSTVSPMKLGGADILWVDTIKYLGVTVHAGTKMIVDLDNVKRKFYAGCNSILCNSIYQPELIRLQLLESYCLPIISYYVAAWDLTKKQLTELNVCWNMMYRKLFGFHKWESVRGCINGVGRWILFIFISGYVLNF